MSRSGSRAGCLDQILSVLESGVGEECAHTVAPWVLDERRVQLSPAAVAVLVDSGIGQPIALPYLAPSFCVEAVV